MLLTVDCLLHDGPLGMHAYVSRPLDLPTSQDGVGMLFAETECRIVTDDLEVLGPNVITALETPAQGDDTGRVQRALEQLRLLVDGMLAYVDGVCVSACASGRPVSLLAPPGQEDTNDQTNPCSETRHVEVL